MRGLWKVNVKVVFRKDGWRCGSVGEEVFKEFSGRVFMAKGDESSEVLAVLKVADQNEIVLRLDALDDLEM